MADDRSSFSDWESVRDVDDDAESAAGGRVVLELPPEGLVDGSEAPARAVGADGHSAAAASSLSSFVPVSRFGGMNVCAPSKDILESTSTASSYQYKSPNNDDLSSTLSNFEILSLTSGEVVLKCKRCHFHNSHGSVVCLSCDLALVANPNVEVDAQIAAHLQEKEEQDARARLHEAERKRELIRTDEYYDHACVLATDVAGVSARTVGDFNVLTEEDLVGLALEFIKRTEELEGGMEIRLAYKCTPHASLDVICTNGLSADRPLGDFATEVEIGHTLEAAFDSFDSLRMMSGEPLRPIPEDANDEKPHPCCLCWIVAVVRSSDALDEDQSAFPPAQTLPLAFFDASLIDGSSLEDDTGRLDHLLGEFKRAFATFFVENLQLPAVVVDPPSKRARLDDLRAKLDDLGFDCQHRSDEYARQNQGMMDEGSSADPSDDCRHFLGDDDSHDSIGTFSASEDEAKIEAGTAEHAMAKAEMKCSQHSYHQCNGLEDDAPSTVKPEKNLAQSCDDVDEQASKDRGNGSIETSATPLDHKERATTVAAFGSGLAVCIDYQDIILWNASSGVHKRLKAAVGNNSLCLASHHGQLVATGHMLGAITVHKRLSTTGDDTSGDFSTSVFDNGRRLKIMDLRFTPARKGIAAVNMLRECQLWNVEDGSCVCSLKGECPQRSNDHYQRLPVARFSPDGKSLASVEDGMPFIHFWQLFHDETQRLTGHTSSFDLIGRPEYNIRAVCFSPDGKFLASAANDCTIRLWEIEHGGTPCSKIIRVPVALSSLAISPDSTLIAGGSVDGSIRIWDVGAMRSSAGQGTQDQCGAMLSELDSSHLHEASWVFDSNRGSIRALVFLPDGKALASVGWSDTTLRLWSLRR